MSRRIEITVPSDWAEAVRNCLEDKERCNLGDHSEKLNMIVELPGVDKTSKYIFFAYMNYILHHSTNIIYFIIQYFLLPYREQELAQRWKC